MPIPNFVTLVEPLVTRFPAAWAKAQKPHDDGEFNARVCAVLHYELGLTRVGRNGKRGNPANLSKDIINWRGTADEPGQNPDPVTGGSGTIIDFIPDHESPAAKIGQIYPDPNGPGAWVKPLTLAQIDAGVSPGVVTPPSQPQYPGYEDLGGDEGGKNITRKLASDFRRAGRLGLDDECGAWQQRVSYDFLTRKISTVTDAIRKHRDGWLFALGLITVESGMATNSYACTICGRSSAGEKGKPMPLIPHTPECER